MVQSQKNSGNGNTIYFLLQGDQYGFGPILQATTSEEILFTFFEEKVNKQLSLLQEKKNKH